MSHSLKWLVRVGVGVFATVAVLLGQSSTAALTGTLQDEQGAFVSGAKITLTDPAKGVTREALTDASGTFLFTQLAPSTYELVAEQPGFANTRIGGVILNASDQRSIEVRLQIAARRESVSVSGEVPLVSIAPAVSTSVNRQFIENQPLNGRTFQTLINLSPGVVLAPAASIGQGQFSVNGQRTDTNYFTVDGVSANFGMPTATNPLEGAGGGVPAVTAQGGTSALASVDAVQEFTLQTSTYAPEYGRQPGAQVAIVTRSGTNALHGSLFEYFRNDKLDANSWFGNANRLKRPALRQNDFGFTVGGPVILPGLYKGRSRTFFFVSYEGLRLIQPVISSPSRVPSLEARSNATGITKSMLEAYPLPVAAPLAGSPAETPYITSFSNPSQLNSTSVRIDHAMNARVSLFGRYSDSPSENRERGRSATPSIVATLPNRAQTATVGATIIGTPRLNNDLRVNWSHSSNDQVYEQDTFGGAKLLPKEVLYPAFADPATSAFFMVVGGNFDVTLGTLSKNSQRQFNVVDVTEWRAGTHSLKFGGDYRLLAPLIGGREFSKVLTVSSYATLPTGTIASATVNQAGSALAPRYHNISAFVQDAWRMAPRLTLTYGLRWEVNPAPSGDNKTLPLTVRGLNNPSTATLAPVGSKLYDTTFANFAPRVGIAYQPLRNHGTVVRAGFGIFYDLGYAFAGTALWPSNFPYTRTRTLTNISFDNPLLFADPGPLNMNPPYPRLYAYYDGYKLPYTLQYSLAVEQPFGSANSLSVSYVGAAGRRLARVESLRPQVLQNANFTRIDAVSNSGSSDYNSLQAQYKRRLTRGAQMMLAYTWAHTLDTVSDESTNNLQAPTARMNPSSDRGSSAFDIRHAFSASVGYQIPALSGSGALKAITGGFAVDSIVRLRSATPVTVVTGTDPLGLGLTTVARPDLVAVASLYLYSETLPGGKRFNPAAFDRATPLAQNRQGTLGRGTLRGFGLNQVDLSLRRQFRLTESKALTFRADAFNVFNTPNFANPSGVMTATTFGVSAQLVGTALGGQNPLFQAGGARSIQLSLKLSL